MDINNDFITRRRTTSLSKSLFRSSSMSSGTSLMAYHNQMEIENNNPNDGQEDRNESLCLSYTDIQANGMSTGGRVDTSPTAVVTQLINEAQTSSIPQSQVSRMKEVDLNFSYFLCLILFFFSIYFPLFYF